MKRGRQTSYVWLLWFVAHLSILFLLWKSSEGALAVDHKAGQHYDHKTFARSLDVSGRWLGRPHLLSNICRSTYTETLEGALTYEH